MARRSAITLAVCAGLALAARRADAQSTTGACAPVIEVGGNVPPRMAQRLRRLLALAQRDVTSAPCERSRVRLEWTSRELTAHIELHDGRVAVRTLESLEDVLPTVLSLLAVPAPDGDTQEGSDDAPPEVETAPPTTPVTTLAPAPPRPLVSRAPPDDAPPRGRGWALALSGAVGLAARDGEDLHLVGRGELSLRVGHLAVGVRAGVGAVEADRGAHNTGARTRRRGAFEPSLVVSARYRWTAPRLFEEVGVSGGAANPVNDDGTAGTTWRARVGVEAAMGWRVSPAWQPFVRAEAFLDLDGGPTPGLALTLGATWEVLR